MGSATSLFAAIQGGELEQVRRLIEEDPSLIDATNAGEVAAVLIALYSGEPAIAELLIAQGAQLDIFGAAATGRLERVRELLAEDPARANALAPDGFQPLGLAAFFGHGPVVELLLTQGAAVNAASANAMRVMPLHAAVANQHLAIARTLIAHGADVNARQADDFTPLHGAAQNGQLAMVELLLAAGADKDAKKADGQTARASAQEQGYTAIAVLL